MPLFMDVHEKVQAATAAAVAGAHAQDVEVRVHREAHGLVADEIHEVLEGS